MSCVVQKIGTFDSRVKCSGRPEARGQATEIRTVALMLDGLADFCDCCRRLLGHLQLLSGRPVDVQSKRRIGEWHYCGEKSKLTFDPCTASLPQPPDPYEYRLCHAWSKTWESHTFVSHEIRPYSTRTPNLFQSHFVHSTDTGQLGKPGKVSYDERTLSDWHIYQQTRTHEHFYRF